MNVVFDDPNTATRALAYLSEPLPEAEAADRVNPAWRRAVKPVVKLVSDRYALKGMLRACGTGSGLELCLDVVPRSA